MNNTYFEKKLVEILENHYSIRCTADRDFWEIRATLVDYLRVLIYKKNKKHPNLPEANSNSPEDYYTDINGDRYYKLDLLSPVENMLQKIDLENPPCKMDKCKICFFLRDNYSFRFYDVPEPSDQQKVDNDTKKTRDLLKDKKKLLKKKKQSGIPNSMWELFDRALNSSRYQKDIIYLTYYLYKCTGCSAIFDLLTEKSDSSEIGEISNLLQDGCIVRALDLIVESYEKSSEKQYLISPDSKIEDLIEAGWNIVCDPNVRKIYNKANNRSNAAKIFNQKISRLEEEELVFFFNKNENSVSADSEVFSKDDYKDVLKTVTQIEIFEKAQSEKDGNLDFELTVTPIYEACKLNFEKKIEKLFSEQYLQISKYDLKRKLGKIATGNNAKNSPHFFGIGDDAELLEIADQLVKHKLLMQERNNNQKYSFSGKFERIWLEAFEYAQQEDDIYLNASTDDEKNTVKNNIIEKLIGYEEKKNADHRKFNLAPTCLFALGVLNNINKKLKFEVINSLCEMANDFSPEKRQAQESAIFALSYFLLVGTEFDYNLKEKVFDACFRGLYPSQISVYKALCRKDKFFKNYPEEKFKNALVLDDNSSRKIKGQPYFYLLQGLCGAEYGYNVDPSLKEGTSEYTCEQSLSSAYDFLNKAIKLEDEIWVNSRGKKSCNLDDCLNQVCRFKESAFESYQAPVNIIAFNLTFYAISHLRDEGKKTFGTIYSKLVFNLKSTDWKSNLLKNIIYTDYHQRKLNPVYMPKDNPKITPKQQQDLTLICGSFRMINVFKFEGEAFTIERESDIVKDYEKFLKYEDINTRYFWFMCRLLNFFKSDEGEKIFPLSHIAKLKETTEEGLAQAYKEVCFLQYDEFPSDFEEFKKEFENS